MGGGRVGLLTNGGMTMGRCKCHFVCFVHHTVLKIEVLVKSKNGLFFSSIVAWEEENCLLLWFMSAEKWAISIMLVGLLFRVKLFCST
jgi:hypothetical protein